ncbi:MAG: hypothetical protein AAF414_17895 [Pseudomonadota bacterium]
MKLCIGSVSGRGTVCVEFLQSVFAIQSECAAQGIGTALEVISGALVEDARNSLVMKFLASDADALLMMDDDIYLDVRVFKRMMAVERGLVGAFCPQRRLDLPAFAQMIRQGYSVEDAARESNPLVGPTPENAPPSTISEVEWIGTGVMLIRRFVFERIIEKGHVAQEGFNAPEGMKAMWNFFARLPPIGDGMGPRGEDVSFCLRARQSGVPVFAYKGPGIYHIGSYQFGAPYR